MLKRLQPQLEEEENLTQAKEKNLPTEHQIECPLGHDVMTLHSEFDRLEECILAPFGSLRKQNILQYNRPKETMSLSRSRSFLNCYFYFPDQFITISKVY